MRLILGHSTSMPAWDPAESKEGAAGAEAAAHQRIVRHRHPRALSPMEHGVACAARKHVAQPRGLQRRHVLVALAAYALPFIRHRICRRTP